MSVTAAAIESLGRLLRLMPADVAWPQDRLGREARRVGLNPAQLRSALELGLGLGALRVHAGQAELLPAWRAATDELAQGKWGGLASKLLESPLMARQVLALLEAATPLGEGYVVTRAAAHRASPQAALLLRWGQPGEAVHYLLPAQLLATHSLVEQPSDAPLWVQRLQRVGHRAEQYTLLLERTASPGRVLHVAAESDRYGYDVEVTTPGQPRRIEVKGSQGSEVSFFLSRNERAAAARWGQQYELQFWGNVNLALPMDQEYSDLRRAGYPRILRNLDARLVAGDFDLQPTEWLVRLLRDQST